MGQGQNPTKQKIPIEVRQKPRNTTIETNRCYEIKTQTYIAKSLAQHQLLAKDSLTNRI